MTLSAFLLSFLCSVLAAFTAGGALAFALFWLREKKFSLPDVTGRWYVESRTIQTAYNPYQDMKLYYVAMLWREGTHVKGTIENIYEISSTGKRSYVGTNRSRGLIEGFVEKNYFSDDRILLHSIEDGHGRESTNFYELTSRRNETMEGGFSSMVANQTGETTWQRAPFQNCR